MTRRKKRPKSPKPPEPTDWQAQALRDLTDVATNQPDDLQLLAEPQTESDGTVLVHLALSTTHLPEHAPKGVRFRAREEFWIAIEPTGDRPPPVQVDHYRFLGVAHVMSGFQICLYLDPSRDWDPDAGIRGVLNRLWRWMEDAAADRFRTSDALYHAVGSVAHVTDGTPTVVVRDLPDQGRHLDAIYLRPRTANRVDVVEGPAGPGDLHTPVVRLRRDIPIGAGRDVLEDLLRRLEATQGLQPAWPNAWITPQTRRLFVHTPGRHTLAELAVTSHLQTPPSCLLPAILNPWDLRGVDLARPVLSPAAELAAAIVDSTAHNPASSHQYAILTVPHPGGGPTHLLCLRLSPNLADVLRAAATNPDRTVDPYKVVRASSGMAMEWCRLSDERRQVTTRRDTGRPVEALRDRIVHIWGVGGLGSWIAEFVVRAGAKRVVLHDPGYVTGGLLVRQNYVEADIGSEKADALVERLRSIRDDVDVVTMSSLPSGEAIPELLAADVVIDATVSRAVGRGFDELAKTPGRRAMFAQVATDARTGTLGIATVVAPPVRDPDSSSAAGPSISEVERQTKHQVGRSAVLEPYAVFWTSPLAGDEFVPTRGCSVPTFHGSAADLASVAGGLLNFIALHIGTRQSGTHLFSLPHSGVTPAHQFVPFLAEEADATPSAVA